jgi:CRP-like cAMP-binding protein
MAGGDTVGREGQEPVDLTRIHSVPWFYACTEEQLAEVARLSERLEVHAEEVLTKEGRVGRELFIILEGTATVTRLGRVINVLGAGDYFGELAAIDPAPRSATVTATTDLEVLIIGPREFEAMTEIPGFRNALLTGMSQRLRQADDQLAAYAEEKERTADGGGPKDAPGHVAS